MFFYAAIDILTAKLDKRGTFLFINQCQEAKSFAKTLVYTHNQDLRGFLLDELLCVRVCVYLCVHVCVY